MSLSDLFFELSNDTRIDILKQLHMEPQRLTDLSNNLDLPAQEISRQLSRLDKMSLTARDPDGLYHATPFSDHLISLVPGYEFLYKHRTYFTTHTMKELPTQFTSRVGELSQCSYKHDIMTVLHMLEGTLREAEEYIHIMLDQMVSHTLPILEEKVRDGVEFHFLTIKDITPPPGVWKRFNVKYTDLSDPQLLDTRFMDAIPLGLILTEKETGLITFKNLGDEIDYTGFTGKDEDSHSWASDVFDYYWATASDKWPEKLIEMAMRDVS